MLRTETGNRETFSSPLPMTRPHLSAGTVYVTSCSPPDPPMLQSPRPRRPITPPKPSRSYGKESRKNNIKTQKEAFLESLQLLLLWAFFSQPLLIQSLQFKGKMFVLVKQTWAVWTSSLMMWTAWWQWSSWPITWATRSGLMPSSASQA